MIASGIYSGGYYCEGLRSLRSLAMRRYRAAFVRGGRVVGVDGGGRLRSLRSLAMRRYRAALCGVGMAGGCGGRGVGGGVFLARCGRLEAGGAGWAAGLSGAALQGEHGGTGAACGRERGMGGTRAG